MSLGSGFNSDEQGLKGCAVERIKNMTSNDAGLGVSARKLLADPRLLNEFLSSMEQAGLVGESRNALALQANVTSRLLNSPINTAIEAPSASGKNWLATRVISHLPSSSVVSLTSASSKSWAYSGNDFVGKVVYLAERNESSGLVEPMRILISEGRLEHRVTEWRDGQRVIVTHVANGPVACVSTTNRGLEIDDATRHLSLWIDPSADQTRRIVMAYHRASRKPPMGQVKLWKEIQRILSVRAKDLGGGSGIVFPSWFDEVATRVFVGDRSVRRYYPAFAELCRTMCLLRSFQDTRKETDDQLTINFADYTITTLIFESIFAESLQRQDGSTLQIADAMRKLSAEHGGEPVRAKDLAADLRIPMGQAYARLREALATGVVERVNESARNNLKLYRPAPPIRFIPNPKQIFTAAKLPSDVRFVHPLSGEVVTFSKKKIQD